MKKKLIIGAVTLALLSGSGGVYAGTLIKQGKTPRGDSYSVEKENVEKNKYAVTIDGKKITGEVVSFGGNAYIPLKSLPKTNFISSKYNSKNWTYNLVTNQSKPTPTPAPTNQTIVSKIDGKFEGWEGDTIFKLMNGQIWQQDSYDYTYHYAFMPEVTIYPTSDGRFKMKVDGVDKQIFVKRLR